MKEGSLMHRASLKQLCLKSGVFFFFAVVKNYFERGRRVGEGEEKYPQPAKRFVTNKYNN